MSDIMRKQYHHDLEQASNELMLLAARVIERIPRATSVLLNGDLQGAEELIQGDADIDAHAVEIEERCIQILALQTPVAGELRQVVAVLKMIAEVERSGDMVRNVCKVARRIYGHPLDPKMRGIITRMGEQSQAIFAAAMEAFREQDAAKAAALDDMDAYLDALQKQFVAAIFESQAAGNIDIQVAVQLAMAARFYERIGDHAVNLGERVRFIVTGELPDHRPPARKQPAADPSGDESS